MRILKAVQVVGLCGVLSACGSSGDGTTSPASYTVTVSPSTLAIALAPGATASASAIVTRQLGASALIDNTATVTWTTSDATIATVTPTGATATITGLGHGVATITASSNGSTGSTTVTVTAPTCVIVNTNPAVTVGTAISGTLSPADCRDYRSGNTSKPLDYYRLVVSANQLLTIDVAASAFTPDIQLISASTSGPLVLETISGATARIQRAVSAGTYTIGVGVASGTGGSYSLTLASAAVTSCATYQSLATVSAIPATISGTLAVSDCRLNGTNLEAAKFYKITLASAQTVTALLASTAFPPRLDLYDSNDRFVISGSDSSAAVNQKRFSTALAAGTYYVRVTGTSANPLGPFTLTLSATPTVLPTISACTATSFVSTITPASTGTTQTGALTTSDCKLPDGSYYAKLYRLTVTSTVNVQIDMMSAAFDTYLYLFDANLNVLATNDDVSSASTDSRLTQSLTPGTYFIGANSLRNATTGAFTLSVKTVP